jgi:hypothetical protein
MPFEPLKTDEKLSRKQKPAKDMDSLMLAGCTGFVGTSILSYGLAVWPFMVLQETQRAVTLGWGALLGLLPAAILGVVAARKFNLPGACGFVGGSMAMSVFLYLRLQQVMLAKGSTDLPHPDFPDSWGWAIPLGWLVLSVFLAVIALPRSTDDDRS